MPAADGATAVQTVKLTINGSEVEAQAGQTILEAARAAGVDIPTLCHDPRLEPYGACRLCLVEVEGARGPMASCGTKVAEGMKVETHSEKIIKLRKFVLELLLTNHPLDCPVCEAAGDCRLQDYAYEYLVDMVPWGWRAPEASDPGSHPNIAHFGSRCILCGRCVRICREVMSIGCWGYLNRGYESEVDTPYRRPLLEVGCVSCGQCVSTCPVGALTIQRAPMGARQWQTEKTKTVCSYCSNGCELVIHTYGGRVVRVTSDTESGLSKGNLCIKGRFGQGYADSDERVVKPLVRNGQGELVEASWDEAVAKVAVGIGRLKGEGKGGTFAMLCGTHCTNEAAFLAQKLARSVVGSNTVAASDQAAKTVVREALEPTLGCAAASGTRADLQGADAILVVGSNLTESNPVLALSVIKAVRRGKTVIVVDPRTTELARRATIHLAPKPGTDAALLRAMVALVLAEGWQDGGLATGDVEALKASLDGADVDALAAEAGVEAADLRCAAEAFARAASGAILFGSGITSYAGGREAVTALADLAVLTAKAYGPGSGVLPLLGGANSQGIVDMGLVPDRLPGGAAVDDETVISRFDAAWGSDLTQNGSGATLDEVMAGIDEGSVTCLYVIGSDPALEYPGGVAGALEKVPFLVVQDSFLSATALAADVVFPAAVSIEDEGTFTNVEGVVQRVRAARAPRGESLPDWAILQRVANKTGADWAYSGPADIMQEIAELVPAYSEVRYEVLGGAGVERPGCGTAKSETAVGRSLASLPSMTAAGAAPQGGLLLITGSVLQHHESGERSRRSEGLIRVNAAAALEMNPADATAVGVADGGKVSVTGSSGDTVEVPVTVTERVPEGVVFLPGFDPQAPVSRLFARGERGAVPVTVRTA